MTSTGQKLAARRRSLAVALGVAAGVVLVDQVTKSVAERELANGPVHVVGPLTLSLGYNTGSAFSLFTGWAPLLATLGIVMALLLGWFAWHSGRSSVGVALGLVLGGALSNVADRLFRGHDGGVVDFVSLRYWPTFNVADACIVVGAATLVVLIVRGSSPAP